MFGFCHNRDLKLSSPMARLLAPRPTPRCRQLQCLGDLGLGGAAAGTRRGAVGADGGGSVAARRAAALGAVVEGSERSESLGIDGLGSFA